MVVQFAEADPRKVELELGAMRSGRLGTESGRAGKELNESETVI
jgi:hypothetical protein